MSEITTTKATPNYLAMLEYMALDDYTTVSIRTDSDGVYTVQVYNSLHSAGVEYFNERLDFAIEGAYRCYLEKMGR